MEGLRAKLPRSISLRLTLLNVALFTLCGGALLVFVAWMAERFMLFHVQESVDAELEILSSEFRTDGLYSLSHLIGERMRASSPFHRRVYRLEDASGRVLASNLDRWPDALIDAQFRYELPSQRPSGSQIIVRFARLPDGSRLLVGFDEDEIAQVRRDLYRAVLWGLPPTMLLAIGSSLLLTRASRRQVRNITDSAHRIMQGDLTHRIECSGSGDEFDALSETLNEMLDRIQLAVAAIRSATDNIAHDLRTPLTRHRVRLERALQDPPAPEHFEEWTRRNLAEVDHILATFNALLRLATIESGTLRAGFAPLDLAVVARDAVEMYEAAAGESGVRVQCDLATHARMEGDRDLLFQAVVNLLDNALKAAPNGSTVTVKLKRDQSRLILSIADQGPGVPAALREKVFERLYRGDEARGSRGHGLGLPIVRAVARLHAGNCTLRARDDGTAGAVAVLEVGLERRSLTRIHDAEMRRQDA